MLNYVDLISVWHNRSGATIRMDSSTAISNIDMLPTTWSNLGLLWGKVASQLFVTQWTVQPLSFEEIHGIMGWVHFFTWSCNIFFHIPCVVSFHHGDPYYCRSYCISIFYYSRPLISLEPPFIKSILVDGRHSGADDQEHPLPHLWPGWPRDRASDLEGLLRHRGAARATAEKRMSGSCRLIVTYGIYIYTYT